MSETQPLLAAIDAGGTSVRLRVFDSEVRFEAKVPADPDGGPAPALALLQASGLTPARVGAGIAKFTRPGVEDAWRATFSDFPLILVPDYEIAFWAALPEGVGVLALAGTGSVFFGRNEAGQSVRVGGRGWEYGDEGSGTHLTGDLVRRTLRALDGLDPLTPLQRATSEFLGAAEPGAFVLAARTRAERDGRGFLVPLVLGRAHAGEREAIDLFIGAAGWLAAYTTATLTQLGFEPSDPVEVRGIGGLWSAGALLSEPFVRVLKRRFPGVSFALSDAPPLDGAARLTCRVAGDALHL
jgi:N-acetylglucosamine kinase-like BadF-type ATPase